MEILFQVVESPIFAICLCLLLGAIAVSGKFSQFAANVLLIGLWVAGSLSLMRLPEKRLMIGAVLMLAGFCLIVSHWVRPASLSPESPAKPSTQPPPSGFSDSVDVAVARKGPRQHDVEKQLMPEQFTATDKVTVKAARVAPPEAGSNWNKDHMLFGPSEVGPNWQPPDPLDDKRAELAAMKPADLAIRVTQVTKRMRKYDSDWRYDERIAYPPPDAPSGGNLPKEVTDEYRAEYRKWEKTIEAAQRHFRDVFIKQFTDDRLVIEELQNRSPAAATSTDCQAVMDGTFGHNQLSACADHLDDIVRKHLD